VVSLGELQQRAHEVVRQTKDHSGWQPARPNEPSADQPAKMDPLDWLEVQILRREAEETLKNSRSR
jgi:hypothetical protein